MNLTPTPKLKSFKLPQLSAKKRSSSRLKLQADQTFSFHTPIQRNSLITRSYKSKPGQVSLTHLYNLKVQEKDQISQKISSIQKRINTIKELRIKYKVKFTQQEIRNLSDEKLEQRAKQKHLHNLKIEAAEKIYCWWKKLVIIRKIRNQDRLFDEAAKKIQNWWKRFLNRKQIETALKDLNNKCFRAAARIQAAARGFIVRKSVGILLKKVKLDKNFSFFSCLKQKALKIVLGNVLVAWSTFKVRQNYIKLFKKTVEKERKTIFEILNNNKQYGCVAADQIKMVLKVKRQSLLCEHNVSEPSSPLICCNKRLRSGTEDFLNLSPRKIDLVY